MRRFLPIFFLLISCSSENKENSVSNEPMLCVKELSKILAETNFLEFKGEITEITEWRPNWLPFYTDSLLHSNSLILELKSADTIIHVSIQCGNRNDNLCKHSIYSLPQLNGYDYVNYFENINCDASFLNNCGFKVHQHSHKINTSIVYSSSNLSQFS